MRHSIFIFSLFFALAGMVFGQQQPVKIAKNANYFYYQCFEYGEQIDTQYTVVEINPGIPNPYLIIDGKWAGSEYYSQCNIRKKEKGHIPGYSYEDIFVYEDIDSVFTITNILTDGKAETYETASQFARNDIKFDTAKVGGLMRYTCSINSNKLEFYVQLYGRSITPIPYYGKFDGLLVSFWRNGQCRLQLAKTERKHSSKYYATHSATRVSQRELNNIKRDRMVITTRIFDDVQLSWGKENSHVAGNIFENTPFDSVLHFAGGALALKRIALPKLPKHYQTFIELHQRSNGDAYDRTGSVFVIPTGYFGESFLAGIMGHPDSLPTMIGKDGQRYQGIACSRRTEGEWVLRYQPPVELMRFFTSFGVGHFNDRVRIDGLEWEDENYYKQEVTDLSGYLQGEDVWIGIWIGNYDGGGHKVTLDLKSYPNDNTFNEPYSAGDDELCQPLFNTCNVLEMAGQNYGRIFGSDSLTVNFTIDEGAHQRLRYISTGHGGWDGGDEFNPKPNTILIDGKQAFVYTPWRCDCGRYREWNPVSGNFWNGTSSSDYSRSGWCPGTATQPVYFDLSHLAPGQHTMTIVIPQGEPQEGSFSHWAVSGVILYEK